MKRFINSVCLGLFGWLLSIGASAAREPSYSELRAMLLSQQGANTYVQILERLGPHEVAFKRLTLSVIPDARIYACVMRSNGLHGQDFIFFVDDSLSQVTILTQSPEGISQVFRTHRIGDFRKIDLGQFAEMILQLYKPNYMPVSFLTEPPKLRDEIRSVIEVVPTGIINSATVNSDGTELGMTFFLREGSDFVVRSLKASTRGKISISEQFRIKRLFEQDYH